MPVSNLKMSQSSKSDADRQRDRLITVTLSCMRNEVNELNSRNALYNTAALVDTSNTQLTLLFLSIIMYRYLTRMNLRGQCGKE